MKYVNKHVHFKLYSEENNRVEKFIVVIIMEWMLVSFQIFQQSGVYKISYLTSQMKIVLY